MMSMVNLDASLLQKTLVKLVGIALEKNQYLMFAIRFSKLTPAGSVCFRTNDSKEELYQIIDNAFVYLSCLGCEGSLLHN